MSGMCSKFAGMPCDAVGPCGRCSWSEPSPSRVEHSPPARTPPPDSLEKQARYQDAKGEDWIDEFARTATADEFRGAMRFTIGKYNRRAGKKDALLSEIRKMRDYCQRWEAYEVALGGDE